MRWTGRTLAALTLGLSLALLGAGSGAARAQAGAEDDRHRQLLADAVAEYNAGRYAEARALFRQAHEGSPSARTLRGIGMAAFELREYVEALRALNAALEAESRPLTDEQRQHVDSLIARANAFVGRYRVRLSPDEASLSVDGAPARLEPDGTLVLNLGEHELVARCPGCTAETRTVRVRGGEEEEMSFELRAEPAEPEPAAGGQVGGEPQWSVGPPPDADRERGSATPVLLLSMGGALAAGALGGLVWWLGRNDELTVCRRAGEACRNEDALATERDVAAGVTVGLGAGAVALAVAGVLSLGGEDGQAVAWSCMPAMGGLGCAGRF